MCGIAGIVSQSPLSPDLHEQVRRMNRAMIHRGPDGDGEFVSPHVMLAMRRLSIIDLKGGWQPLYNEDRSLALVANGEIYNFVELRQRLESKGHRFTTHSDCETILHLYEEHGLDCVQHLRGMFAFALWDAKRRRLILGRDRMGEKPLYLYQADNQILFASELKSLLASGIVPFDLDPHAINLYFHYQYVPEPLTPLQGVRKLPAAHLLTIDTEPWRTSETCYWRMEDAEPIEDDAATRIREVLEDVAKIVVRSDVPVGVALSGGLDSSAVAALAVKHYPNKMHAFSVGYPGRPPCDERADAKALADHLGMPFHDVELRTEDMVSFFPDLVYWRDDPIADISGYGYYAVMKAARDHGVPVMLQGQGGDELFWGYPWVKTAANRTALKQQHNNGQTPSWLDYWRLEAQPAFRPRAIANWVRHGCGIPQALASRHHDLASPPNQAVFYDIVPDYREAIKHTHEVYSPQFTAQLHDSVPSSIYANPQPPRADIWLTKLISETYLCENGIVQGDRLSMTSSVELRLPLLDHKLVETVIGCRKHWSDLHQPPKAPFRAALRDILPNWVMNRRKQGFAPPVKEWYESLFAEHGQQLTDGYLVQQNILTLASAVALATGSFPSQTVTPLTFKALVLESWCRGLN
jgi:asparagine synthase (glutamine-hydrolysing)